MAQCPMCYRPADEEPRACPHCRTAYHPDCWPDAGCVVAGCAPPPVAAASPPEQGLGRTLGLLSLACLVGGFSAAIASLVMVTTRSNDSPTALFLGGATLSTCLAVVGLFLDQQKSLSVGMVAVSGLLLAILVPNVRVQRRPSTRACYANQKTIVGAIEMYNLDKNTRRTVLDASFFQALKSGGYLQSIPQDAGSGPGSSANYREIDTGNGITCTVHGSIQ